MSEKFSTFTTVYIAVSCFILGFVTYGLLSHYKLIVPTPPFPTVVDADIERTPAQCVRHLVRGRYKSPDWGAHRLAFALGDCWTVLDAADGNINGWADLKPCPFATPGGNTESCSIPTALW